jgi:O-antigen/teichoic acid export membrane protein
MSTERRVAKNAAWLVLQPLVMNVLSLAATAYIARELGASEFGRFNLAYAFAAMFAPLTNLGLRPLAVRHIAQNRGEASDYLGKVLVLRGGLAVVIAVILIAVAPLSGGSAHTQGVVAVAAVGLVLATLSGVFTDGFQSFEVMRPVSLANMVGAVLLTLTSVLVVWRGGGIQQMAMAYLLGPLCSLVLLWLWSRGKPFRPHPNWNPSAFYRMLRQALPFFGLGLLEAVSARIDVLVLARAMGDGNLGSYTVAMTLVDRAMNLCDGAATALFPAIAHLSANSPAAVISLLRNSALWLFMLGVPIAIGTTVLSPLVVALLFGPQYAAAAPLLALAIWRLPIECLAMLQGHSLFAVNRQNLVLRTAAVATVFSILTVYPLVQFLGPLGGVLALLIRPSMAFLMRLPALAHHFPNLWPWAQLARVVISVGLMVIPLALIPPVGLQWEAGIYLLASAGIYLLGLMLFRVLPLPAFMRPFARPLGEACPSLE